MKGPPGFDPQRRLGLELTEVELRALPHHTIEDGAEQPAAAV
ncbi:MAG TPA: hypothetical protein VGK89_02015 [Candidatus Eisenbacteria bacterium]